MMDRQIKFKRAFFFDEERTQFSHYSEWGVGIKGSSFTSPSYNNFAPYFRDYQFTGLHDKNEVEIYEGDILKRSITFVVEEGHQPSIYYDKVIYSGGGFKTVRIDDENRGHGYLENYVGHTIEVIGNIHL